MKIKDYPGWVLAHKVKGTEIRHFNGRYYLYKISSFWDKEKKKSRKKTDCLLGRITEEGLKASKPRISEEKVSKISVVESGMSEYVHSQNEDILEALTTRFPKEGQSLFLLALFRLAYQSPLKNMSFYYDNSFMSQVFPKVNLGKNNLTELLKEVGTQRSSISECMKDIMGDHPSYVLIDQTHIISLSEQMTCNRLGYNSQRSFEPQVNLLFIFSPEYKVPLYYRMVAGDVRETKALKLTLEESGIREAIVIGDKGFYSKENIENLSKEGLDYILPIRRSHSLCEYEPVKKGNKELFDSFFAFDERIIWYKKYKKNGHDVILFLDNKLKEQEEKDYLLRIKKEEEEVIIDTSTTSSATNLTTQTKECQKQKGNTLEKFYEKQHSMGTITLNYSLKNEKSPEQIFMCFKTRNEVENTYDAYKNIVEADTSYMQGQAQMETWSFINFLALIMYFRIYKQLLEKQMLKKYAPKDVLLFLEHIKKMKINDKWLQAEITKKSQTIIDMLRTYQEVTV